MASDPPPTTLPNWHYQGVSPTNHQHLPNETVFSYPALEGPNALDLGNYRRSFVSNVDSSSSSSSVSTHNETETNTTNTDNHMTGNTTMNKNKNNKGRAYFDFGLRLMLSYQHEMAAKAFLACLEYSPYCALAHGLIALCHSPNYNFKGDPYYESTNHYGEANMPDLLCIFPSQQVADRHSKLAVEKVEQLRRSHKKKGKNKGTKKNRGGPKSSSPTSSSNGTTNDTSSSDQPVPTKISDVESQLLAAIRVLTCCPGVDPSLSYETVGRPFANAMRRVYQKYPQDPEVIYVFCESLMVLNAWKLYDYPSGQAVSPDVQEVRNVLEDGLRQHPTHAGLCHLYVHLSEMSSTPEMALSACQPLRTLFPDAGHLLHMGTHIDVLVGDYESCVRYNEKAIVADTHVMQKSPSTAGKESFYFGYIVHNYHMLVFGAILGGMEAKAMEAARNINRIVSEEMLTEFEDLASYLESYAALDIHVMVRFGRWEQLLEVELPKNKRVMLYRAASIHFARGLARAALGDVSEAKREADRFDSLRKDPEAENRILHNNSVARLLAVDAVMLRGEIAYREGNYDIAFAFLRRAVEMQDGLNYDEPWGKMQPIRHALGGLLQEQGHTEEAIQVFRRDLEFHPKNPFALVGLIKCLKSSPSNDAADEIAELEQQLESQRGEWTDYDITVPCECCGRS